jgi:hypothetical protein
MAGVVAMDAVALDVLDPTSIRRSLRFLQVRREAADASTARPTPLDSPLLMVLWRAAMTIL